MTLFRWNKIANEYYLMYKGAINGVQPFVVPRGGTFHFSYDLESKYPNHGRIVFPSTQLIYPNVGTYDTLLLNSPRNYSLRIISISDLKIKEWVKLAIPYSPLEAERIIPLTPIRVLLLARALSGEKEYSLTLYSHTDDNRISSKKFKIHSTHLGYMKVEGT